MSEKEWDTERERVGGEKERERIQRMARENKSYRNRDKEDRDRIIQKGKKRERECV